MDDNMLVTGLRVTTLLLFLYHSLTITWSSVISLVAFIITVTLMETDSSASNAETEFDKNRNPLKGKPKTKLEDIAQEELRKIEHDICRFVTYDATEVQSLDDFQIIKSQTECVFARNAKLWGSPEWKIELSLEENILRTIPTFYKFVCMCPVLGLDGFVYELPGEQYGMDLKTFGTSVRRVLHVISDNDPVGFHCMDKSYIDKRGWVFEFNKCTMFVTTFAPFYPASHSRYTFSAPNCYILLQPEISFAQHDLPPDTAETNWDSPRTVRDRTRCAYRNAGRPYLIRHTISYPMVHDIVKPVNNSEEYIEWWKTN